MAKQLSAPSLIYKDSSFPSGMLQKIHSKKIGELQGRVSWRNIFENLDFQDPDVHK